MLQAVLGLDITWRNLERLPPGRHVMVSNHSTTGDLMVLYSLPRRCVHLVNAALPARVTQVCWGTSPVFTVSKPEVQPRAVLHACGRAPITGYKGELYLQSSVLWAHSLVTELCVGERCACLLSRLMVGTGLGLPYRIPLTLLYPSVEDALMSRVCAGPQLASAAAPCDQRGIRGSCFSRPD